MTTADELGWRPVTGPVGDADVLGCYFDNGKWHFEHLENFYGEWRIANDWEHNYPRSTHICTMPTPPDLAEGARG